MFYKFPNVFGSVYTTVILSRSLMQNMFTVNTPQIKRSSIVPMLLNVIKRCA